MAPRPRPHDEALHADYRDLSAADLYRSRRELRAEAGAEQNGQERRDALEQRIEREREAQARNAERRVEAEGLPKREREEELRQIGTEDRMRQRALERLAAERAQFPEQGHDARAELAAVERVIEQRERAGLTAAKVSPPDYIVTVLGARPSDPAKQQTWDRAVRGVEGYRLEHGVKDKDAALGPQPRQGIERVRWEDARRELHRDQRSLDRSHTRERALGHGIEL